MTLVMPEACIPQNFRSTLIWNKILSKRFFEAQDANLELNRLLQVTFFEFLKNSKFTVRFEYDQNYLHLQSEKKPYHSFYPVGSLYSVFGRIVRSFQLQT